MRHPEFNTYDGNWRALVAADIRALRHAGYRAIASRLGALASMAQAENKAFMDMVIEAIDKDEELARLRHLTRTPEQIAADEERSARYREEVAAFNQKNAGNPYCPSNGSEGMDFEAHYCDRCAKHDPENAPCQIWLRGGFEDIAEWIYARDGSGPTCTAYEPVEGK